MEFFFGGRSVEHEISILTAQQAMAALNQEKYSVVPVYMTKDGAFFTGAGLEDVENFKNLPKLLEELSQVTLTRMGGKVCLLPTVKKMFGSEKPVSIDVAVLAVHGTFVEDGSLQGLMEIVGLPYTGCDVLSSAICMQKPAAKTLLRAAGVPVLPDVIVDKQVYEADPANCLLEIESVFSYPVVIKPSNLGSSVGITRADSREKLENSIELAYSFADQIMVEPCVVNLREINVSVLGNKTEAQPSVCEEPIGLGEILSYTDKYLSGGKGGAKGGAKSDQGMASAKRVIPAEIPLELSSKIQETALKAFSTLGCSGIVRIDFLLDDNTTLYLTEVNTIPGSLSFYLWEPMGISFTELMERHKNLAFDRQRARNTLTFSYETNILANMKKGLKN